MFEVELCRLQVTARAVRRVAPYEKQVLEGLENEPPVYGELWTEYDDAEAMIEGIKAL
jgi:hypothetical protein